LDDILGGAFIHGIAFCGWRCKSKKISSIFVLTSWGEYQISTEESRIGHNDVIKCGELPIIQLAHVCIASVLVLFLLPLEIEFE